MLSLIADASPVVASEGTSNIFNYSNVSLDFSSWLSAVGTNLHNHGQLVDLWTKTYEASRFDAFTNGIILLVATASITTLHFVHGCKSFLFLHPLFRKGIAQTILDLAARMAFHKACI